MKHLASSLLLPLLLTGSLSGWAQEMTEFSQISRANNQFAFDLLKAQKSQNSALFFSPFSINAALTMAAAGAEKETLAQMQKVLHHTKPPHAEMKSLLEQLKSSSDYELLLANRIWGQQSQNYKPEFLNILKENYQAELTPLDFYQAPEPSRKIINQWVSDQTKSKIPELLKAGDITTDTDLVLTNAIYFKGAWKDKFEASQTHDDDFHLNAKGTKKIPFMNKTSNFGYAESKDYQMLSMLYKGNELSFVALLPHEKKELGHESAAQFQELYSKLTRQNVQVQIPKFKTDLSMELKDSLSQMGMPLAFDKKRANFHGMRTLGPNENLAISKVVHQAVVEVNEEGTEAAAATATVMVRATALMPRNPPIKVLLNRPFLYFIVHQKSGTILFMGRFSE
jgi:serpin B